MRVDVSSIAAVDLNSFCLDRWLLKKDWDLRLLVQRLAARRSDEDIIVVCRCLYRYWLVV